MSSPTQACANCGKHATMRCAGCIDAPEYQRGDSSSTFYCTSACQKRHRSIHKAHCKAMSHRKKLLRAAIVLKAALLGYRERMYDIELRKIEFRDGVLYLHQKQRDIPKRGPFPDHLTTNIAHKEAALANNQCSAAMALLGRLTRMLLADVPCTLEVLDLHIGKPSVPTKLIPGPDCSDCPHTVIKIGLRDGEEIWVLDTAGCQYGFGDVLIPYPKYIADHNCRVRSAPITYKATETKDIDYYLTLGFMTNLKTQRLALNAERQSRLRFASFVDKAVAKDILDGSAAEFNEKLEVFKLALRLHMST